MQWSRGEGRGGLEWSGEETGPFEDVSWSGRALQVAKVREGEKGGGGEPLDSHISKQSPTLPSFILCLTLAALLQKLQKGAGKHMLTTF